MIGEGTRRSTARNGRTTYEVYEATPKSGYKRRASYYATTDAGTAFAKASKRFRELAKEHPRRQYVLQKSIIIFVHVAQ